MDGGERKSFETVMFFVLVSGLAFLGSAAKALSRWETEARSIARLIGSCLVSMFVAIVVGLALFEVMPERPMLLLAITGAAAYLGVEIADSVMRRVLGMGKLPIVPPPEGGTTP